MGLMMMMMMVMMMTMIMMRVMMVMMMYKTKFELLRVFKVDPHAAAPCANALLGTVASISAQPFK
jgi:hypothetical protein